MSEICHALGQGPGEFIATLVWSCEARRGVDLSSILVEYVGLDVAAGLGLVAAWQLAVYTALNIIGNHKQLIRSHQTQLTS